MKEFPDLMKNARLYFFNRHGFIKDAIDIGICKSKYSKSNREREMRYGRVGQDAHACFFLGLQIYVR